MTRTARFLAFGLSLLLIASFAEAQERDSVRTVTEGKPPAENTRVLKTIVVTGSRTKQVIQEAPAAMSVIGASEIENAAPGCASRSLFQ